MESQNDLIELIDHLVPDDLFAEACAVCAGKGWYFGNLSTDEHAMPFWKMDLDGNPAFDAIWQAARPHCEKLAGRKLRVLRQYANGHTYGLGGQPHRDDDREGTFTLLYYPMPVWKPEWQGETVFHDEITGEIELSISPRPNRAVFFDARIPHAGRAPSRSCPALRVTVAFKLEAMDGGEVSTGTPESPVRITELEREGASRVYRIHADAAHVSELVAERLQELAKTLRLPGYRQGKIPAEFLVSHYGARTRAEVLERLGVQAADLLLARGCITASLQIVDGSTAGDAEFILVVTHLPDLPESGAGDWELERLTASDSVCEKAGLSAAEAAELLASHLHMQALDRLHDIYQFPVAAPLVARELDAIRRTIGSQSSIDENPDDVLSELKEIAERRVRLGAVLVEMSRRHQIQVEKDGPSLESRVIEWLVSQGKTITRPVTPKELQDLVG